ncbi:MAG: Nif3-like dinuclear metal center hexameric protein [Eubacterium sp.]|nr:Nif3-like dinuclear metal center hexameric protein [Eubacterium sp.]
MRCNDIIKKLEEEYPLTCAEEWDNPGLLVGRRNREVRKIYVTLDATERPLKAAIDWGADLIISHHPLLFKSVKQINDDTFIGRRIIAMIENDISYYAMHTNFDVLGMAHVNERQLELADTRVLDITRDEDGVVEGIGRVGYLPIEMTLSETAEYVRKKLKLPTVRCYGLHEDANGDIIGDEEAEKISRVAICGGSGKSVVSRAIEEGAQVLITGDIDYHTAIDALAQGLHIIDAGHYGTEYCFIEYMTKKLQKLFPECEVKGAEIRQPYAVV